MSFVELSTITLSKEEVLKQKEAVLQQKGDVSNQSDVYIAFVNAKTGEIINAEKNPTGVEDTN